MSTLISLGTELLLGASGVFIVDSTGILTKLGMDSDTSLPIAMLGRGAAFALGTELVGTVVGGRSGSLMSGDVIGFGDEVLYGSFVAGASYLAGATQIVSEQLQMFEMNPGVTMALLSSSISVAGELVKRFVIAPRASASPAAAFVLAPLTTTLARSGTLSLVTRQDGSTNRVTPASNAPVF